MEIVTWTAGFELLHGVTLAAEDPFRRHETVDADGTPGMDATGADAHLRTCKIFNAMFFID